jgi:DNA-directed RNA polymerase subunit RPC12/RpoP
MKEKKRMITVNEDHKPRVVCPHCLQEILINIMPFKDNVSQIISEKCPRCGGEIFVGLLILCHPKFQGLMSTIQRIVDAANPKQRIIGNRRG